MELKSTINIILKDLEDARDLIDDLRNYPGVPLIQIELARSKCRSAADVIRLLSSLLEEMMEASAVHRQPERASEAASVSQEEKESSTSGSANFDQQPEGTNVLAGKEHITPDATTAKATTEDTAETTTENTAEDTAETTTGTTAETTAEDTAETTTETTTETTAGTTAEDTAETTAETTAGFTPSSETDKQAGAKPGSEKHRNVIDEIIGAYPDDHDDTADPAQERGQLKGKETPKIVADRFTHLSERINEQIGDSRNGEQEMSRVKKKITDIKKEIGINDRFFLIRELFDGNQEKYISALNELNSVTSNEEAKRIIERYRAPSGDREAGKMLSELVRIKLSSSNG